MVAKQERFDYKAFLRKLPSVPGIYKMLSSHGTLLYVGKASNLKSRVSSYFNKHNNSPKLSLLVSKIKSIEIVTTASEVEALLLEQNVIKQDKPFYNIILRDDKSYPYIALSQKDDFPRLFLYRGARKKEIAYFGPYPSVSEAKQALSILQKAFNVRQCKDSYFKNRIRPCLQYQIKRCKAPCVNYVSKEEYAEDVELTVQFLKGKNHQIIEQLMKKMSSASQAQAFEKAAEYRDQISILRKVQYNQVILVSAGCVDVLAISGELDYHCVVVLFVREGRMLGSRSYFPESKLNETQEGVLSNFIAQFYLRFSNKRDYPEEVIVPFALSDSDILSEAISAQAQRSVVIKHAVKKERRSWLDMAKSNASQQLKTRIADRVTLQSRFRSLKALLRLKVFPERIDCFDVSHLQGDATLASCVVFNQNGAAKSEYRRFKIKNVVPGDDYAAMQQVIRRRYDLVLQGRLHLPDIILIDGGKGQLGCVLKELERLKLSDDVLVLGLCKGLGRKAQYDRLINGKTGYSYQISDIDPGLHLLQFIRDEAHRFAVQGNRSIRNKKQYRSVLEGVDGVGAKRRAALLNHFGGIQAIRSASVSELSKVTGISKELAQNIWAVLHNGPFEN